MTRTGRKGGLLHFILTVFAPAAVIVLLANLIIPNPSDEDLVSQVRSALGTGQSNRAEAVLARMVDQDSRNLTLHRDLIRLHFDSNGNPVTNTDPLIVQYMAYAASLDPVLKDLGHYAMGLIVITTGGEPRVALESYGKVADRSMVYLNNSIGYARMQMGDNLGALEAFAREIEVGGNVAGAFSNMFRVLHRMDDFGSIQSLLMANPDAERFMPPGIRREFALHEWRLGSYAGIVLSQALSSINPGGFAAAFLILILWFLFLRSLDVFEPERLRYLVLVLAGGMVLSLAGHFLYDLVRFGFNFELNGGVLNDLFFCVFIIGGVEETVKIIPLLLLMAFSRQVDERVDYLIYAGMSALGFAFMENLLYFDTGALTSVHGRAFTAVVLHMSLSVLAAWGLVRTHRKPVSGRKRTGIFLLTFFAAMVFHGLYDFFLLSEVMRIGAAAFLLLLIMIALFQRLIINALNNSRFWTETGKTRFLDRMMFLQYGLTAVVLAEFLVLAVSFGPDAATEFTLGALFRALVMILVLTQSLGVFPLEKGLTVPIYNWKGLFRKERKG